MDLATPDAQAEWVPPVPLEWRAVLEPLAHGRRDPSLLFGANDAWRAVRLQSGVAEVRLAPAGVSVSAVAGGRVAVRGASGGRALGGSGELARVVRIQAWGPGAAEAVEVAPDWLGRSDDWSGFDALDDVPDAARKTRAQRPGLLLSSSGGLVEHLAAIILQQKVTSQEAHFAWGRLVRRFGSPAPGAMGQAGELFVPPSSEAWERVPSWEWHQSRVDAHRRNAVVAAMRRASGLRRLEASAPAGAGLEDLLRVERGLRSIPGVGMWAAAEVLQRSHGSGDHVSFGDYHVAHTVGEALTGRRVTDTGMERLLSPWSGQRQRVVKLLMAGGARKQRFGSRMAPADHTWH